MTPKRRMVYRFYMLPFVSREQIIRDLQLTETGDQTLQEEEKYAQCFRRAERKGILDQMWNAIEQKHEQPLPHNPFAKH